MLPCALATRSALSATFTVLTAVMLGLFLAAMTLSKYYQCYSDISALEFKKSAAYSKARASRLAVEMVIFVGSFNFIAVAISIHLRNSSLSNVLYRRKQLGDFCRSKNTLRSCSSKISKRTFIQSALDHCSIMR